MWAGTLLHETREGTIAALVGGVKEIVVGMLQLRELLEVKVQKGMVQLGWI